MVIKLHEFEDGLIRCIGRPTSLRPFVCAGSPLTCKAFIVGFNPATEMSLDFWDFWRTDSGFDKAAWFANYLEERQRRPLKPGKKRRPSVSNTRRVIEWIIQGAAPVSILETNIHAIATEKKDDLPTKDRKTKAFDFLIDQVKPDVVVAHGKDASDRLRGEDVAKTVIEVSHFSRGWSESSARALGQKIKLACTVSR